AAGAAAVEEIGHHRRGDPRAGGIRPGRQHADPAAPGRAVAGAGVAAGDPDVAGHGREGVGRPVELLAVDGAAGRVAAVDRRRLRGRELDREPLDRPGRHASDGLGPLWCLPDAVRLAHEVRAIRCALRSCRGQVRLVEAQHVTIEVSLVLQSAARDDVGHGDERRRVGRGADEDVLVRQLAARARDARIDADDAHAVLPGALEVLQRPRAEGTVAGAPAPHDDEPRIGVVDRLTPGALVLGLGAVGLLDGEDLGLRREIAPELGAAPEHVEKPLASAAAVEHRQAAGARAVEDGRGPVRVAHAPHLARDLVERRVPRHALELSGAARPAPAQRMAQTVRVIDTLELTEAAHARVQGRHLGGPAARIGADLDDLSVADVRVDGAAAAAVVAAGAGDDGLAGLGLDPRRLVDGLRAEHATYPIKVSAPNGAQPTWYRFIAAWS